MFVFIVKLLKFVLSVLNEFLHKNGASLSASISFYTFFSLFPLLLGLIAVFSLVGPGIDGMEEKLIEALREQIPVLAEADDEFLGNFFESISKGRGVGSVIAIIGLFWVSQQVFSSIRKNINIIWGIDKTRPFLKERIIDLALMFGASTLLLVSVFTSGFLVFIEDLTKIILPETPDIVPVLWKQLALFLPWIFTYIVFLVLYWWLPNVKVRFKEVWLTSLLGAIAFEISKFVFIFYLRNMSGMASNIYGGVSTIIVLMIFIYVSSIILLVGAMLTMRYSYYLSNLEQKNQNEKLSKNLQRIRSTSSMINF
ncbi:MAG: YihY/virulence factor BrkB family protein [Dehalococcoidia bacterium]